MGQKDCVAANNAWIVEPVRHHCRPGSPDCGTIIDPGFGGGGRGDIHVGRRHLQVKPPKVEMRGRCIESCKKQDIYACRTEKTCTDPKIGGTWQPRPHASPGSPTGFCRQSCSVDQPYQCKTSHDCTKIGGKFDDPKLCHANNGNSPFVAIEFRDHCSVWVQYVLADDKSKKVSPMMRLVGVGLDGGITTDTLLDNAKTICGKTDMVKRLAEDFSGILALSKVDENKDNTLTITVNDPIAGNTEVEVTNNPQNRAKAAKEWKKKYNVNTFNPEKCGR